MIRGIYIEETREQQSHSDRVSQFVVIVALKSHALCQKERKKATTFNTSQFHSIENPLRRFMIRDSLVKASLYLVTVVFIDG